MDAFTQLVRMGPALRVRNFHSFGVTHDMEAIDVAVEILHHFGLRGYSFRKQLQLLRGIKDYSLRRLKMQDVLPVRKQRKHKPKFGDDLDLNLLTPAQISNILTNGTPKQVRQILTQFTLMGLQSAGVKHADATKYIRLMYDITRDEALQALPTSSNSSSPPQEDIAGWTSNDS